MIEIKSKEDLKNILKSSKLVHYVIRSILNYRNPQIRNMIIGENESLIIERKGDAHSETHYYLLQYNNPKAGFFAIMKEVLNYCEFADRHNLAPVVVWGNDILYYDKNKKENSFEYYFIQPAKIAVKDLSKVQNLIYSKPQDLNMFTKKQGGYSYSNKIMTYAYLYKKYIHLNDETKNLIYKMIAEIGVNERTIGVHIRGTDYKRKYNRHPVYVEVKEYQNVIKEFMKTGNYDKIFLATDDQQILEEMVNEIGSENILYVKEAFRSTDGKAIHYGNAGGVSPYQLGYDVLKDVYLLANCGGLIGSLSNVSMFAQIVKRSEGMWYKNIQIIDKGVNKNFNEF